MRITNTKINETVKEVAGEDTLKVVEYLKDKKNISDFKIAESVKSDIHEIRNILYRLYNHNLVSYYRKKDRQKGWYISYWTFNKKRISDLMSKIHYDKIERFEQRLLQEEANRGKMYMSPDASVRVSFDEAMELNFRCPETGALLKPVDNDKTILFLKERLAELRSVNPLEAAAAKASTVRRSAPKVTKKVAVKKAKVVKKTAKKVVKKATKKVVKKTAKKATKARKKK